MSLYQQAIDSKLDSNLRILVEKLDLRMEQVEEGQAKHFENCD